MKFQKGSPPWNKGKRHLAVAGDSNPMKRAEVKAKVAATRRARGPYSPSVETREKLRQANLGKKLGASHKLAIGHGVASSSRYREALKRRRHPPNSGQFPKGSAPKHHWAKGQHGSPATEFTSESLRQAWSNPTIRNRRVQQIQERWANPEFRARMRMLWDAPEHRAKLKTAQHTPEAIEKRRRLWANEDFRIRRAKGSIKGLLTRPTSLERQFIKIGNDYPLPFKYVGDGSFFIGRCNPDFIHQDKRRCIEVANRYHHKPYYEAQRVGYYKLFGWDCIVLWEEDLADRKLVLRRVLCDY